MKAFNIHWAVPTDAPKCAAMLGSATAAPVTEKGNIMLAAATARTTGQNVRRTGTAAPVSGRRSSEELAMPAMVRGSGQQMK
ncbi:hypothetical protein GCM10009765_11490 [Fodinicola feengrottensis]|uniref:Uncharacterized protein n=1 Tax=Fodinicola feengrottensis TaxID=435914 RepID=A0ABN2G1M4_9ACTN